MILVFLCLCFLLLCNASITVYFAPGQQIFGSNSTVSASPATFTNAAAYNLTTLNPPPVPSPPISTSFSIQLQASGTQGLSIPQAAGFMGFSIEMSVVNQVLGKNSSFIQIPFLNLMANIQQRSGRVNVRVGGNSQERAALVDNLPDGKMLTKGSLASDPTQTPTLLFTTDLLYLMRNISDFVNVRWYIGAPFNDSQNFRLQIVEQGQIILGDYLQGIQVGNEPDLYPGHLRGDNYTQFDYFGEFGSFINATQNDSAIKNTSMFMGPSISGNGKFTEQDVWNTGFIDAYSSHLVYLTVEHYPDNNCGAVFQQQPIDPQTVFANYLSHDAGKTLVAPFLPSVALAQQKGKPYIMFETNTASCGGFPGVSDSFGAALWTIDYGLTAAANNFSQMLMHVGGQQAFYNPFTPPPTNQALFHRWTIGPVYYGALIMAEAMGPSNGTQVLDLNANGGNSFTPAYAIYESGVPVRVALFNYITDPSGASDYTVSISIGGAETGQPITTPSQVKVKYLTASSVAIKYNFTWAGQTFGNAFGSDGRLEGDEDIRTVNCDQDGCSVQVPAPGFALVFLDNHMTEAAAAGSTTFATTAFTRTVNTVMVDPSMLATSNGHSGKERERNAGSTSKEDVSLARTRVVFNPWMLAGVALISISTGLCWL